MRYLVYETDQFRKDIDGRYRARVDKLIKAVERAPTLRGGFERYPKPFLKRRIENSRLIAEEHFVNDETIALCFVRFVPRSDKDYKWLMHSKFDRFKATYDFDRSQVNSWALSRLKDDSLEPLPELDPRDYGYLYWTNQYQSSGDEQTVYETSIWVDKVATERAKRYHSAFAGAIQKIVFEEPSPGLQEMRIEDGATGILYRNFSNPTRTVLVAPFFGDVEDVREEVSEEYSQILDGPEEFDNDSLLRHVRRAYPAMVTLESDLWMETQSSREANLALSPEEAQVIHKVMDSEQQKARFPLFINGRPGSGKSTVLQYLFAKILKFHLELDEEKQLSSPPLYLTYSDALLQRARKVVEDILRCDASTFLDTSGAEGKGLATEHYEVVDRAFGSFRDFMLKLLPPEEQRRFNATKYVDYSKFRTLWELRFSRMSKAELKGLSPELGWHVIRTYVKGMQDTVDDVFDPECYDEYPEKRKSVSQEHFELIYSRVWENWYRDLCREEGYWDDQDLTRAVLDLELQFEKYPAIFCDEAQDFTRQELEFLFSLSHFSERDVPTHELNRVPFAFAGDPFQTLNPTGFNWDAVKADFHENIVANMGDSQGAVKFNFEELQYNYRSSEDIARLGNTIQLLRGVGFEIKGLEPQLVYFQQDSSPPEYFSKEDTNTREELASQEEVVIVIPCQEGGEMAYIEGDDLLREIALDDSGKLIRHVFSPMRAKGLEFNRVVLYGFGDYGLKKSSVCQLTEKLNPLDFEPEEQLPAEYFINELYVAASRAQLRLLIVDSQRAIERFWHFCSEFDTLEQILTDYNEMHSGSGYDAKLDWTQERLGWIQRGSRDSWEKDRDDPTELAQKFFEQGQAQHDPFVMERAATVYERLGEAVSVVRCEALAREFEGRWLEAAESYLKIDAHDDAIRCYWQEREFAAIAEIDRAHVESREREHRAARHVASPSTLEETEDFLRFLRQWLEEPRVAADLLRDEVWSEIGEKLVDDLGSREVSGATSDHSPWLRFLGDLLRCRDKGLSIPGNINFIRIAHRANDPARVAKAWERLEPKPPMEPWLAESLAQSRPFPERLVYLADLEKWDDIVEAFDAHGRSDITIGTTDAVVRALLKHDRLDEALELLEESPSTNAIERLLALPVQDLPDGMPARLAERLLTRYVEDRRFEPALDLPERAGESLNAWSGVEKRKLIRFFIRLIARSDDVVDAKGTIKEKLTRFILNFARSYREAVNRGLDPRELGAAIERAGRRVDALKYYESVIQGVRWEANPLLVDWARRRWAKVKKLQLRSGTLMPNHERIEKKRYEKYLRNLQLSDADIDNLTQYPRRSQLPTLSLTEVSLPAVVDEPTLNSEHGESAQSDTLQAAGVEEVAEPGSDESAEDADSESREIISEGPSVQPDLSASEIRGESSPENGGSAASEGEKVEVLQKAVDAPAGAMAEQSSESGADMSQLAADSHKEDHEPSGERSMGVIAPDDSPNMVTGLSALDFSITLDDVNYEVAYESKYLRVVITESANGEKAFLEVEKSRLFSGFPDVEVEELTSQSTSSRWAVLPWKLECGLQTLDNAALVTIGSIGDPPALSFWLEVQDQ